MSTVQTRSVLWSSGSVSIDDVVCRTAPHRHGMEEVSGAHRVVFVRSGAFQRTIGRESVLADPTHVLFFTRGQPYRISHPISGGDRCTVVTVPPETLLEIGHRHRRDGPEDPDEPFAGCHALSTARAALLHQALLGGLQRMEMASLAAHELTLELLDEALGGGSATGGEGGPAATASRAARELAEATRILVSARYAAPPSLDALGQALGCSPFHLCRSFRRTVGLPLRRYLDRLRLRLALDRLAAGEPDLTTLALDLGYADHSHFTNAFRREFGRPPSALRVAPPHRSRARGDAIDPARGAGRATGRAASAPGGG